MDINLFAFSVWLSQCHSAFLSQLPFIFRYFRFAGFATKEKWSERCEEEETERESRYGMEESVREKMRSQSHRMRWIPVLKEPRWNKTPSLTYSGYSGYSGVKEARNERSAFWFICSLYLRLLASTDSGSSLFLVLGNIPFPSLFPICTLCSSHFPGRMKEMRKKDGGKGRCRKAFVHETRRETKPSFPPLQKETSTTVLNLYNTSNFYNTLTTTGRKKPERRCWRWTRQEIAK